MQKNVLVWVAAVCSAWRWSVAAATSPAHHGQHSAAMPADQSQTSGANTSGA